jgi:hypothetical protein
MQTKPKAGDAVEWQTSQGETTGKVVRKVTKTAHVLGKRHDDLTAGDIAHMRKVVGYVHRHLAQRPEGDVSETPWRYSLMNWGHDPTRKA